MLLDPPTDEQLSVLAQPDAAPCAVFLDNAVHSLPMLLHIEWFWQRYHLQPEYQRFGIAELALDILPDPGYHATVQLLQLGGERLHQLPAVRTEARRRTAEGFEDVQRVAAGGA